MDFPYQNLISSFWVHVLKCTRMSLKSFKVFMRYPANEHKNRKANGTEDTSSFMKEINRQKPCLNTRQSLTLLQTVE